MVTRLTVVFICMLVCTLSGCWSLSDEHDVDSFALTDSIEALKHEKRCSHPLEVVRSIDRIQHAHRDVASLSTSCSPGVPHLCERRLKERACALGADALVLSRGRGGVSHTGAEYNEITLDGRALRWID